MTQNIIHVEDRNGQPARITMGWDRQLQEVFCNVVYFGDDESLDEEDDTLCFVLSSPGGIVEIRSALIEKGFFIPQDLFTRVVDDAEGNLGNVVRQYSVDGVMLKDQSR